ncbi:glycosyltransferase 87 family protein [Streptomyces sp. NPDC050315]|uniref:glycosyltransferase 87 family protein n=1 Tax=Streptomyces sp. NPDC050315 TaxID=3155039 RepID=UPI00341D8DD3
MTALKLDQPVGRRGPFSHEGVHRRRVLAAALACAVSFAAFWIAQRLAGVTMLDLMVYRAEGWTARTGGDLYDMLATSARLPNTYPPFASLLFVPLTFLGVPELRTLATLGNLLLLVAVVHLTLRLTGLPSLARGQRAPRARQATATLALSALLVWCEPVWTTLRYGQINLLLAVLVLWDLTRRDSNRWAGIGIGIAAGIKLTPALFAVWLALAGLLRARQLYEPGQGLRGTWNPWLRQACVAVLSFLGTVLLSALVLPRDSARFWTEIVFASDRPGDVEITANQSLRGVLARLLHTPDTGLWWPAAAALAAIAGLALATTALLRGERAWAAVVCATTALLVSPISWSHHWVWAVPMLVLLGTEAVRSGGRATRAGRRLWSATGALGLLFASFALWWVPHRPHSHAELHQNGGQMLLSGVYPIAGVALLLLAAAHLCRAGAPGIGAPGIGESGVSASPGRDHRPDGRDHHRGDGDGTPAPPEASPRTDASSPCPRVPADGSGT